MEQHGHLSQVISNTGFEFPCSTNGESYRFSPLWSNGPRLHGGNPIGFVPASRGGIYIESKPLGLQGVLSFCNSCYYLPKK